MKLKEAIQTPCGLRYVVDALDIQSSVARRMLLEQEMMTQASTIEKVYADLQRYIERVRKTENSLDIKTLQFRLHGLKDLYSTLQNLQQGRVLDDIELFEIKHIALLTGEVQQQMQRVQIACELPDLTQVVNILDPEGLHMATFYVYDAYSTKLRDLRKQLQLVPNDEKLYLAVEAEENAIRLELTQQLRNWTTTLYDAYCSIAHIDIQLAKAIQMVISGFCIPTLSVTTTLTRMWNPEVEEALQTKGKTYQRNSLTLANLPTVLIGSNMGGKTVVLKTVALCQYLTQFGFAIPAEEAEVAVKDAICCSMSDGQDMQMGLSSFAAEMETINGIIQQARQNANILALVDEPARTTNPEEGTALVTALCDIIKPMNITMLMVTHYTIHTQGCPRLRVKGLENGQMNYDLVSVTEDEVPHEALNIAEQLGIDTIWLERAKQVINR